MVINHPSVGELNEFADSVGNSIGEIYNKVGADRDRIIDFDRFKGVMMLNQLGEFRIGLTGIMDDCVTSSGKPLKILVFKYVL